MDAREKLRRFLEQRREAGVRELVLDDLTVAEVMRLVGAGGGGTTDSPPPDARHIAPERRSTKPDAPSAGAPTDWRSALRAAGAEPAQARVTPSERSRTRSVESETPRVQAPNPSSSRPMADEPGEKPSKPARGATSGPGSSSAPSFDDIPSGIEVGGAGSELFGGPMSHLTTLDEIAAAVASCTRCPLYRTATNPVPGEGNPNAGLMCVGEAPGATEDATGRPFVGQAGQLLDRILSAINLSRNDVFICNVLKHRPPQNRNPLPDEVRACSPYLVRQIELIRPRVILALGTFAAQTLLNTKEAIGKLRGKVHRYYGVPLVVTYHPAALLRNPAWKRPTWDDVQLARRLLDRANGL